MINPSRAGVRGRRVGEPAVHLVLALLAAVHRTRCVVEHLWRTDQLGRPDHLLSGRLRCGARRHPVADHRSAYQLRVLSARQPRDRGYPASLLPWLARLGDRPAAGRPGAICQAEGRAVGQSAAVSRCWLLLAAVSRCWLLLAAVSRGWPGRPRGRGNPGTARVPPRRTARGAAGPGGARTVRPPSRSWPLPR